MTYNEIMQKAGKRIKPNLYYYNNDVKIEISRNDIIKIRPHYSAGLIGTIMRGLEIELKISIPTSTIYFKNMAMFEENSQTKDYGEYYLKEKGTYNADTKTYTYQFYDGFLKLMVPYKAITIDYPCTVNDFIKKLANEMGLKCNIELTNGSNYLGTDIYENIDMTYRDVIADIGQGTFTLFEIVNNELKVCNFKENEININDDILKNKNITFNKKNGAFNTIIISRSAESDSLSKSNPENLPDDEKIAYRISDCQLLNRNDRGDYLDGLLNKVYGIEYYIYDVELTGFGGFEPLQKIKFETGSETFYSYVLNNEEIITQGYEENISASEIENVEQNYKVTDTDDRKINNVSLIVDKQQKEINALANKVVDISKTVSGVGFVNITNGYKGNLHKLDIYGYMELPIVGGHLGTEPSKVGTLKTGYAITKTYKQYIKPLITGEFKVNNFYLYIEQDDKILHKYLLPIKYLYSAGDVHDEFNYLEGKCSVTRKVGIHANGVKYALSTPYTEELPDLIIEVPEGDYKIYTTFDSLHLDVEYLTQNEYTNTFATQVELQSEINVRSNEIELLSKKKVNSDEVIASINLTPEKAQINANKISLKGKEISLTSDNININSTNFKVDKDGNCTANSFNSNNAIITGGRLTLNDSGETINASVVIKNNILGYDTMTQLYANGMVFMDNDNNYNLIIDYDKDLYQGHFIRISGESSETLIESDMIQSPHFNQVSLKEYKKDFEKLDNALSIIKNTDIYKYHLKSQSGKEQKHIGLVIGDEFKYSKEILSPKQDGVDLYSMISTCFKAIQEQQEQIEKIEKRIEALERNDK